MFQINEDNSIYVTRGDSGFFDVTANNESYIFKAGDLVRIKVFGKKNCEDVVLQKDFPITTDTERVEIFLEEKDTKIGKVINKPTDYWYEIELNPLSNPQTIIGYGEDGPAMFRLFPEGRDLEADDPVIAPEDIPIVDGKLDLSSKRPVENRVVAREIIHLHAAFDETKAKSDETAAAVGVERARIDNLIAHNVTEYSKALDYLEYVTETTKAKIGASVSSDGVFATLTVNLHEANLFVGGSGMDVFIIPDECRPIDTGLIHTEDGLEYRINYDAANRRYCLYMGAESDVTYAPSGAGSVTIVYKLGDYELKDIRVGADGEVYNAAGEAVRRQFSQKFTKMSENGNYDWLTGHKIPVAENCGFYGSGEYYASNGDMLYCVPVEENTKYQFTNVNDIGETKTSRIHRLAFATKPYDSTDKYIALIGDVIFHQEEAFTTPSGCRYIIFTVNNTHYLVTGEYETSIQKITDKQPIPVYPITENRFNYALADNVFIPYLDKKIDDLHGRMDDIEIKPESAVIAWGDSLTYGAGSGDASRYSYTAVLSQMIGKEIVNYGVGGESIETILGRQGGLPMIVKPKFTIPSDYTSVEISLKSITGGEVSPLLQSAQAEKGINPCFINGVEGNLSYANGKYFFTRKLSGESVLIDRPVMLVTKAMKETTQSQILLLWIGQNNANEISQDGTIAFGRKLICAIHSCVDYVGTDKYLILSSPIDGNINQYSEIFEQLATEFGGKFVNVFEYLLEYGLEDAGITATNTDKENLSTGRIPNSLRYDGVHLNANGYNSVAKCVYLRGRECGYWD